MRRRPGIAESAMRSSGFLPRLAAGLLLVNLCVAVLAVWSVRQNFQIHEEQAELATQNLARALESDLAGAIRTDEMALHGVLDELYRQRAAGRVDVQALNFYIERVRERLPEIDAIRITDAQGVLLYGTGVKLQERKSLADRPHFIRLRDDPAANLAFSKPQISRVNGKWVQVLAHRIERADGTFDGMVFAAIPLDYLARTFSTLDIGKNGMVALRDADLELVVRYPESGLSEFAVGGKMPPSDLSQFTASGMTAGSYIATSSADGIARMISFRKLPSYPLYIQVGWARDDYLAATRQEAKELAVLVALFVLLTLVAGGLILRTWQGQRRINRALAESETRLNELFENMSSGVAIYRVDGDGERFVFDAFNRAAERIEKMSRGEVIGRDVVDVFPGIGELGLLEVFRRVWRTGKSEHFPLSFYRDGRVTGWRDNFVYKLPGGEIVAIYDDVTERKLAEHLVQISMARLNEAQRIAQVGNWELDLNSGHLYWSDEIFELFELDKTQFGASYEAFLEAIHPDDRDRVNRAYARSLETREPYEVMHRLRMKDGRIKWVNERCETFFDEQGKALRSAGTVQDITERKLIEDALRQSEAYNKLLFVDSRVAMVVADAETGRYIDCNQAAVALYRMSSREAVLGLTPLDVSDSHQYDGSDSVSAVQGKIAQALEQGSVMFEWRHRRPDGEVWDARVHLMRLQQGERRYLLFTLEDITEQKQFSEELHNKSEALQRSNADLERFAYSVSHDMRQPLRAVSGHLQLLQRSLKNKLDDDERENMNFALDGARRMDSMIVSLLDYSRVGRKTEAKAWLQARTALDDALGFLEPAIHDASAEVSIAGEWPQVYASRDELVRLFQNLIGNGIKFCEPGKPPRVEVESGVDGGIWRVGVRDHGIGIDPQQTDRLFQFFSRLQARTRFDGTGMGLALCRRIVEHHGGKIWVESEGEGHGSLFVFELPLGETHEEEGKIDA